ncbi:MAG TPA: MSHA biogenesis protein MshI [Burkholderiales bacterium]|nr:MSHA biogenesis protein MshI [Burkholderiales bacterium]
MSQNINLFNTAFRKQRQVLTLATVAQLLGITLVALFGYHYYLQQQVGGLAAELQGAEGLLKSQRGYVDRLKGRAAAPKADTQLEADIARYEAELKLARGSMDALKGGAFGNQQGFAEYLRAFSRQSVNGLWLTGFTIAGSGELEIRGRVLSPDLVPGYIQRLNKEQVLAGRSFARLEMNRPKPEAVANKNKDAKIVHRLPHFLEFSLATSDTARTEKMP